MEPVTVSVIISTKNRGKGLLTCLAHLEQQSYPAARFEVLLVDVGSTDDTFDVISRYAKGAPVRTRCLQQQEGASPMARNHAVREAEGEYVLFLDSKLFASPHLLEKHIEAHERLATPAAVAGAVSPHPQMEERLFNRWFMPDPGLEFVEHRPLPYLSWRRGNLSLPRQTMLNAGGFDESFRFAQFSDAELAWRLIKAGTPGFYQPDAHAYVFVPTSLEQERKRQYAKGYSLYMLAQRTGDTNLLEQYGVSNSNRCEGLYSLLMPLYKRLCTGADEDSRLMDRLYPKILKHDLCMGFHDAVRGREPRTAEWSL